MTAPEEIGIDEWSKLGIIDEISRQARSDCLTINQCRALIEVALDKLNILLRIAEKREDAMLGLYYIDKPNVDNRKRWVEAHNCVWRLRCNIHAAETYLSYLDRCKNVIFPSTEEDW